MTHFTRLIERRGATVALALIISLGAGSNSLIAGDSAHSVKTADEVEFGAGPPLLPPGAELAVLAGNPGEPGVFVIRLRFPEGYVIPPHTHSMDELVTVISGQIGIAMGETLDQKGPLLPAGSFAALPANMAHFAWANEITVVQIAGMGPFDITYLEKADDPRTN
ncbi:cupin domain-containing protein [Alloyangia pacifica]|uniref:cupin domain-containing protein n=1 Tax=Alloyangia pacifica TaxID=311180 RepID=UPI0031D6BA0D